MAGRNPVSIDNKIKAAEENVIKTKAKYTEAVTALEALMAKKKAIQNEELLRLFENSPRTYKETVEFLTSGMTDAQIEKSTKKKPGRKPRNIVK